VGRRIIHKGRNANIESNIHPTAQIYRHNVAQLTLIDWNVFDPTKLFPTESSLTLYLVLSGFGYVTSFLLGYALLTLGAIYASKLVPELRV